MERGMWDILPCSGLWSAHAKCYIKNRCTTEELGTHEKVENGVTEKATFSENNITLQEAILHCITGC